MKKNFPTSFYWFFFALILTAGRFALLCSLYLFKTPFGDPVVENIHKFLWHTTYVEAGICLTIAFCFHLISFWVRGKGITVLKIAAVAIAFLYLASAGTDDEVQRWMCQKFSPSFLAVYISAFTDTSLAASIFWGDAFHFILTVALVILFTVAIAFYIYKIKLDLSRVHFFNRKNLIALAITFVLAVAGCTSFWWYHPLPRRQVRIKPVTYTFISDFIASFESRHAPDNYREGILALGGNPDAEYPFWKEAKNETESIEEFKQKPLEEKPDIILFTIESLRGWTSDMRIGSACEKLPHLCKLAQSGLYFPNTHSVGAPSIEGLLGIMEGILSHPYVVFFNNYPNTRMRSLPEILREAGYYTEVLMGTDPRFANEEVWFKQWFDYVEYIDNSNDVDLANRFLEHYKSRPSDKPLFYHWMSRSMHVPYDLPKDMGPTPDDPAVAYMRAIAYMDSSLGIILDAVEKGPKAQNTLFILTGDHSSPNGKQVQLAEKIGKINDGHAWISLLFSGPNIDPRIDIRQVSQSDIAPSILGYLGLDISNHFMGQDLLQERDSLPYRKLPAVFAFEYGDMGMWEDSLTYYITPLKSDEPAIALKSYLEPTWDTTQLVNGFSQAAPIEIPKEQIEAKTATMRAAAKAWEYVIYKNLLMPPRK
jgi:Phosphoglycerol transferase and related proteins, alkaline phosphatase superfamily